jgi:hypothetical protein
VLFESVPTERCVGADWMLRRISTQHPHTAPHRVTSHESLVTHLWGRGSTHYTQAQAQPAQAQEGEEDSSSGNDGGGGGGGAATATA